MVNFKMGYNIGVNITINIKELKHSPFNLSFVALLRRIIFVLL